METFNPDDARLTALQEQLAASNAENAMLRAELDETNRGVVALYAEIDSQAEEVRRSAEMKSRFLSYMSHEFRTPIVSIQSIARILIGRMDGPLTEEQEVQVRFIQDTSTEFAGMVDDLLDLAKVDAGRVEISPAWFDMVDLFSALRGMFKPVLENKQVTLVFEEPQDVPRFFSDDRKLGQILRNFVSNALKFTPRGEVRVSARREGQFVTFSVADTGIGIASQFHDAVFEDFTQIDSPIQKHLRGTGLGLSLCKRLAELLGGSVGVRSVPTVGSTFFVTLPLKQPEGDAAPVGEQAS